MLRQFSRLRIIGSFIYDSLVTQIALLVSTFLYAQIFRNADFWPVIMGLLRGRNLFVQPVQDILTWQPAGSVFVFVALIWPFYLLIFGVYNGARNPTLKVEMLNLFLAISVSTMTVAGMLYFSYRDTPRRIFTVFFLLDFVFLLGARVVWWAYRRQRPTYRDSSRHPVLIVGANQVALDMVKSIREFAWSNFYLVGYVDDDPRKQGKMYEGIPVLGGLDDLPTLIETHRVHDAVVTLPLQAHDRMIETCRLLQKQSVHVRVVPDLFSLSFPSASLEGFGGIPLVNLGLPGIYGWKRTVKRAFDLVAATLLLALFSPIMIMIALLIRLGSAGPIFYRQERIGEHSRRFYMIKFRSMYTNSDSKLHRDHMAKLIKENASLDDQSNGTLKLKKDPRITPIGHFIRKTSLDELPQLLNVLRGDMSLVGPRPPVPYEVELYKEWHKRRFEAIPGMTGIWQVQGRNRVSFDEMIRMDIEYIEKQSLWMDIKLLLLTPLAVLNGRGAG